MSYLLYSWVEFLLMVCDVMLAILKQSQESPTGNPYHPHQTQERSDDNSIRM